MIIKRSTYEAEILRAFQSGRERKVLYNDDEQAMMVFADSKKFSLKSVPKAIILGSDTGMIRAIITPSDCMDDINNMEYEKLWDEIYAFQDTLHDLPQDENELEEMHLYTVYGKYGEKLYINKDMSQRLFVYRMTDM